MRAIVRHLDALSEALEDSLSFSKELFDILGKVDGGIPNIFYRGAPTVDAAGHLMLSDLPDLETLKTRTASWRQAILKVAKTEKQQEVVQTLIKALDAVLKDDAAAFWSSGGEGDWIEFVSQVAV